MATMGRYTQERTLRYDADPAIVWSALLAAVELLYQVRPSATVDTERRVSFATGITSTSWGEFVTAAVCAGSADGCEIRLRGKPKSYFLVSRWGEREHLRAVARRLDARIRTALRPADAPPGRYPVERLLHVDADPQRVWTAVLESIDYLDCMQVGAVADGARRVDISTGPTLTSWGQDLTATVTATPGGGADVRLVGEPRIARGAMRWAERDHLRLVGRRLRAHIRAALADA
jgi:hypothetical protein